MPSSQFDVPVGLPEHRDDTGACATPLETALDLDWFDQQEAVAEESAAGFVDATRRVCPSEPCPAVIGNFMVLRDSHHLAPPFAQALAGHLEKALAGGIGSVRPPVTELGGGVRRGGRPGRPDVRSDLGDHMLSDG